MEKRAIIKSSGVISFATNLSRILGLVRDVVIARFFGTGMLAQAFIVSFRIPNMLRDLIGEGATNAAFVPVLTEYKTIRSKEEFWNLAAVLFNIMLIALSTLTLLGIISAPLIIRLIAPGFISDPEKLNITIRLTKTIFPYIFLIGLCAYSMGVLNTLRHFAVPAYGPALLNISVIISCLLLTPRIGVMGLAVGVLVGGVLQLCLQISALVKKGFRIKRFTLFHPAAKRIGKLLIPRMLGSAVYQINILVDNILASFAPIVGAGAIGALWFSYRLWHYPFAIVVLAFGQAALPAMSAHAANNDIDKLKETISFSLRTVFFIIIPASIGLMVLGRPIIASLFEGGAFSHHSADITYTALFYYSIGLFGYSGGKILRDGFYSLQDTKTPVKIASVCVLLNILLSVTLMWPLKVGGLALATSIAGISKFFLLSVALEKKIGRMEWKRILSSFARVLLSAIVMGLTAYMLLNRCPYFDFSFGGTILKITKLLTLVGISVTVFLVATLIFKVKETAKILQWILRRK